MSTSFSNFLYLRSSILFSLLTLFFLDQPSLVASDGSYEIKIRSINHEELVPIVQSWLAKADDIIKKYPELKESKNLEKNCYLLNKYLEKESKNKGSRMFLFTDENDIPQTFLIFMNLAKRESFRLELPWFYLDYLVSSPENLSEVAKALKKPRRSGYARKAIQLAYLEVKKTEQVGNSITAFALPNAFGFYERLGFVFVQQEFNDHPVGKILSNQYTARLWERTRANELMELKGEAFQRFIKQEFDVTVK